MKLKLLVTTSIINILFLFFANIAFSKLRVGDFVLLPMNCYACRVISDESGSPYSHLGMVMNINKTEVTLVESLGKVGTVSLKSFKRRLIPGETLGLYRLKEWDELYLNSPLEFKKLIFKLKKRYELYFHDLPYDDEFLWGNRDDNGNEKLYCSEFITKLINPFLSDKIGLHPMNYLKNWDFWVKYMGGQPPQGLPGNNPSFFTDQTQFLKIEFN